MPRTVPLFQTEAIDVYRFDHPVEDESRIFEKSAPAYTASFVEAGAFDLTVENRRWRLNRGDVMMVRPGMDFRAAAPGERFVDVCLSVRAVGADFEPPETSRDAGPRRPPFLRQTNRLRYLRWSLTRAIEMGDGLLAEFCANEVFAEHRPAAAPLFRDHKLSWYAERVHAARERLDRDLEAQHTLSDLARSVGMSMAHFIRTFTELVGVPPHQYRIRARLKAARAMLLDGLGVTETSLACGFNDLSHFSRTFARRYGVAPSRVLRPN